MKNIFKNLGRMIVIAIGWCLGSWLWERFLKDIFEKLKYKLSRKD